MPKWFNRLQLAREYYITREDVDDALSIARGAASDLPSVIALAEKCDWIPTDRQVDSILSANQRSLAYEFADAMVGQSVSKAECALIEMLKTEGLA